MNNKTKNFIFKLTLSELDEKKWLEKVFLKTNQIIYS